MKGENQGDGGVKGREQRIGQGTRSDSDSDSESDLELDIVAVGVLEWVRIGNCLNRIDGAVRNSIEAAHAWYVYTI